MKRICIIGGSGTGKTTLSNNLSKELNLPVYILMVYITWKIGKNEIRKNVTD